MKITLTITFVIFAICVACCSSAQYYNNAKEILDRSQGKYPEGLRSKGHARGHAKGHASGHFSINSLQDYSFDRNSDSKTGFKSRADQNRVVHLALKHRLCQNGMIALNRGSLSATCTVPAANTVQNLRIEKWIQGKFNRSGTMRTVFIKMAHFKGNKARPLAPVFIITAFPKF